jgi:hypothetical protein
MNISAKVTKIITGEGAADNSLFCLNGMKITQKVLLMTEFYLIFNAGKYAERNRHKS